MSLSKDQKRELGKLKNQLKKFEKMDAETNIDLDVFMSDYQNDGFSFYVTEKIGLNEKAAKRRNIYENNEAERQKIVRKDD